MQSERLTESEVSGTILWEGYFTDSNKFKKHTAIVIKEDIVNRYDESPLYIYQKTLRNEFNDIFIGWTKMKYYKASERGQIFYYPKSYDIDIINRRYAKDILDGSPFKVLYSYIVSYNGILLDVVFTEVSGYLKLFQRKPHTLEEINLGKLEDWKDFIIELKSFFYSDEEEDTDEIEEAEEEYSPTINSTTTSSSSNYTHIRETNNSYYYRM
jgi:hypothetical protein